MLTATIQDRKQTTSKDTPYHLKLLSRGLCEISNCDPKFHVRKHQAAAVGHLQGQKNKMILLIFCFLSEKYYSHSLDLWCSGYVVLNGELL